MVEPTGVTHSDMMEDELEHYQLRQLWLHCRRRRKRLERKEKMKRRRAFFKRADMLQRQLLEIQEALSALAEESRRKSLSL